jgi:CheY-like chemotaxis protein
LNVEPGHGSTFKVYLPSARARAEETAPAVAPSRGVETVLLVDDEEMVRQLVTSILAAAGYTVLGARDAAEALQVSEQYTGPIHLLLTGLVMPEGAGGRELARQLTAARPDLKVIYMSGYSDAAMTRQGLLRPDMAFVQKPFSPRDLQRRVREVLDSAPARRHVLIVEDDAVTRESWSDVLKMAGFQVSMAAGGRDGLAQLEEGVRPDVILLDLVMPGVNGWVFRREQQKNPDLAGIPVVITSGYQESGPAVEGLNAAKFLRKPVDPAELLVVIAGLCGRQSEFPHHLV